MLEKDCLAMKKWLAWVIVGGPVLVYAIGKLISVATSK